jgi:two-component system sensor histidine kinase KdpD
MRCSIAGRRPTIDPLRRAPSEEGLAPSTPIFQPFQRLGSRDNASGLGLGLASSRGLVEAMSGTPSPDGTPGGGMTITISLPAAAEPNRHADSVEPHRQRAGSTLSRAATASERP